MDEVSTRKRRFSLVFETNRYGESDSSDSLFVPGPTRDIIMTRNQWDLQYLWGRVNASKLKHLHWLGSEGMKEGDGMCYLSIWAMSCRSS